VVCQLDGKCATASTTPNATTAAATTIAVAGRDVVRSIRWTARLTGLIFSVGFTAWLGISSLPVVGSRLRQFW
jgi:hypothetical protein